MESIPEHGRLDEIPLPRLLLGLQRERFGGAVTLSRERVGKRFLFRDGLPIFAESNLASESLGVQLMDAGRITRADYNRLIAHVEQREVQGRQGAARPRAAGREGSLPRAQGSGADPAARVLRLAARRVLRRSAAPSRPPTRSPSAPRSTACSRKGIETHWSSERVLADLHPRMELFPELSARSERIAAKLRSDDSVAARCSRRWTAPAASGRWSRPRRTPRGLAALWVLDAAGALALPRRRQARIRSSRRRGAAQIEIETTAEPEPLAGRRAAAAVSARRAPSEAEARATAELRREIGAKHARLSELDYYQLLDLPADCDAAAIKRAYHVAAKTYHPDTLARSGLDAEARAEANRVFAEISKAHATLSDPERRRRYDEERRRRRLGDRRQPARERGEPLPQGRDPDAPGQLQGRLRIPEARRRALARRVRLPVRARLDLLQEDALRARGWRASTWNGRSRSTPTTASPCSDSVWCCARSDRREAAQAAHARASRLGGSEG